MSLLDMINARLGFACGAFAQLIQLERNLENREAWRQKGEVVAGPNGSPVVTDEDRAIAMAQIGVWTEISSVSEMPASGYRVFLWKEVMAGQPTLQRFLAEVRAMRETIQGDLEQQFYHRYASDRAKLLITFEADWARTIASFPSARKDALSAVDCYALGHNDASVFHSMRVAESGLRALARERRVRLPKDKPIDWAQWQNLIEAISKQAEQISNKPACEKRDAALAFYRGAVGQFSGFKDMYRNSVVHGRANYDEFQAASALVHVRDFMNRLSEKIGEASTRQIAWGFR